MFSFNASLLLCYAISNRFAACAPVSAVAVAHQAAQSQGAIFPHHLRAELIVHLDIETPLAKAQAARPDALSLRNERRALRKSTLRTRPRFRLSLRAEGV